MEISEQNQTAEEFYYFDEDESDTDEYDSDDSQDDPTFEIVEEIRSSFSRLSTKNDPKSRTIKEMEEGNEEVPDALETVVPELDDEDQKSFKVVQNIIEAGHMEKLKVDQCKVYLRKHGLRLTGKKDTLLERIREHLDILNGGGEKKYPISSFLLNCKGDACTGDVVMFEQKIYKMFNIASRSASGPPCGTRIVAGRIVKESYGAAKQQHTFTIEVLWCKGEKPLPPLYPLLIKGRNLYRLKTMRQKWENESERQKILSEKHTRGSLARSNREARVQEKRMRKMLKAIRVSRTEDQNRKRKETKTVAFQSLSADSEILRSQSQSQEQDVQQKEYGYSKTGKESNSVSVEQLHRQLMGFFPNANLPSERINQWQHSKSTSQSQNYEQSTKPVTPSQCHAQRENFNRFGSPYRRPLTIRNHLQNHNTYLNYNPLKKSSTRSQSQTQEQDVQQKEYGYSKTSKESNSVSVEQLHRQLVGFFPNANLPSERINQWQHSKSTSQSQNYEQSTKPVTPSQCHAQRENFNRFESPYRRPLIARSHLQNHNTYPNYNPLKRSSTQWQGHKQQFCQFYAHGRCYYGNHCKFLHEARKN